MKKKEGGEKVDVNPTALKAKTSFQLSLISLKAELLKKIFEANFLADLRSGIF